MIDERIVRYALRAGLVCALAACLAQSVVAQPHMRITSLTVAMPRIEVRIEASCDEVPVIGLGALDIRLHENGVDVPNFSISCPNDSLRCALNVALVIDGSGSMQGQPMEDTKRAAKVFIAELDGVRDSAAVVGFNSGVYLLQSRTTSRVLLEAAVDRITPAGLTSLWDGSLEGLRTLEATTGCRALIVLTDGRDNTSAHTPTDLVARARQMGIPIFMIGLGISVDDALLESIATITGGRTFFTANSSDLARIFSIIARTIKFPDPACTITYSGECLNTETRTLAITVMGACTPLTDDTTFATPGTIGTTTPVRIIPLPRTRAASTLVRVPVVLPDPTSDLLFGQADAELLYDGRALNFLRVEVPPASLLGSAAPLVLDDIPGRLRVRFPHAGTIRGSGALVDIAFQTAAVTDTTCTSVQLVRWSFTEGCIMPLLDSARVCIVPCPSPPAVTARGATILCPGETVVLDVPDIYTAYRWSRDGQAVEGDSCRLRVDDAGDYCVEVETEHGCILLSTPFSVRTDRAVSYAFGQPSTTRYIPYGEGLDLPVSVEPPLLAGRFIDLELAVRDSASLLSFAALDIAASTLPAWASVEAVADASGTLHLRVRGVPAADASSLGILHFSVLATDEVTTTLLSIAVARCATDCLLDAHGTDVPVVIDGTCTRVVARRSVPATLTAHPNPASDLIVLALEVASPVRVRLSLVGADGVDVLPTPFPREMREVASGRHVWSLPTGSLASGLYRVFALFDDGTHAVVSLVVVH